MEGDTTYEVPPPSRGWPRAVGLLGVLLTTSILPSGVLIAVPLLLLLVREGLRSTRVVAAAAVAALIAGSGTHDGLWFAERAWSVLIGGGFLGLTMALPSWGLSQRALGAVLGAGAIATGMLALQADAWLALDVAVSDRVRAGVDSTIHAMSTLGGREPLSPALVTALQEVADAQAAVFPALTGLASMAALGLAWWARTRLVGEGDPGLGPLKNFRFNDHLVWVLVAGLLLLVLQWGDALVRVGSNTVVFMGALYTLRGAAVFMFVSGGLSLLGYVAFALSLALAAPVIVGVTMLVGIGDTWLDIRSRAGERAA